MIRNSSRLKLSVIYKNIGRLRRGLDRYPKIGSNIRLGRWDPEEHQKFIKSCIENGNDWLVVEKDIKTRTALQIRTHFQKFMIHLCKKYSIDLSIIYAIPDINERLQIISNIKNLNFDEFKFLERFIVINKDVKKELILKNNLEKIEDIPDKIISIPKINNKIFKIEKHISKSKIVETLMDLIQKNNTILDIRKLYSYKDLNDQVNFVNNWLIDNKYKVKGYFTNLSFEGFVDNLSNTLKNTDKYI